MMFLENPDQLNIMKIQHVDNLVLMYFEIKIFSDKISGRRNFSKISDV